jgi:hypothetical protein
LLKVRKISENKCKKKAKKCKMQMQSEKGIEMRIALNCTNETEKFAFSHFVASYLHRNTILGSLWGYPRGSSEGSLQLGSSLRLKNIVPKTSAVYFQCVSPYKSRSSSHSPGM